MDFTGGLALEVGKLPAELQAVIGPILQSAFDRIAQLETQAARDTNAVADKVIAAVIPQLQAMTQTVNAVADQAMRLIRRLDGAQLTVKLGPEL